MKDLESKGISTIALEGWSDCLRIEVKPFGIKTPWGIIAAENLKKTSGNGAYAESANKSAENTAKTYSSNQLTKPEAIAKVILKAVTSHRPKTRYVKGYMAKPTIFMRKWFGDRFLDRMLKAMA